MEKHFIQTSPFWRHDTMDIKTLFGEVVLSHIRQMSLLKFHLKQLHLMINEITYVTSLTFKYIMTFATNMGDSMPQYPKSPPLSSFV